MNRCCAILCCIWTLIGPAVCACVAAACPMSIDQPAARLVAASAGPVDHGCCASKSSEPVAADPEQSSPGRPCQHCTSPLKLLSPELSASAGPLFSEDSQPIWFHLFGILAEELSPLDPFLAASPPQTLLQLGVQLLC